MSELLETTVDTATSFKSPMIVLFIPMFSYSDLLLLGILTYIVLEPELLLLLVPAETRIFLPVIEPELKEVSGLDLDSDLALLNTALVIVSNVLRCIVKV